MANKAYPPSICPGIPRLGICPSGWKTCTFGDILTVVERPIPIDDDTIYQLVTAKRNRGGIVPREQLKGREIKTQGQYAVRAGDFLIGNRQIIHGACGIVPESLDAAIVSGEYTVLLPKKDLYLPWLAHFAHTVHFQQTCFQSSIGVDVEKMVFKVDWWLKQQLHVPPLSEQKKMVAILETWDTAVDQTYELIARARYRKRGLAQLLLTGQCRLVDEKGMWKVQKIEQVSECIAGGTPQTTNPSYWGGTVRWMVSGELNLKTVTEVEGRITEKGLLSSNARMLPRKCVLIGLAGQGKTRGTVAINTVELCTNQSIAAILPAPAFIPEYLYHNLDARYDELRGLSTGDGGRGGLNLNIIKSLSIPLPSINEQCAIAAVLTTADYEIRALEAKAHALEHQKKGLMQKLLIGGIRSPDFTEGSK